MQREVADALDGKPYVLDWKQHLVPEREALGVTTHLLAGPRRMKDLHWPGRLRALARRFDVVHIAALIDPDGPT